MKTATRTSALSRVEAERQKADELRAIDTDSDVKVDHEQSVSKGNDVLRLDVEVGSTAAMQKSDAFHQLATEICNLAGKHPKCESNIQGSGFGEKDERPHIQIERLKGIVWLYGELIK